MLCVHTHLCFEWCRLGYEPVSVTIKWWLFALVWWHSLLVVVFCWFCCVLRANYQANGEFIRCVFVWINSPHPLESKRHSTVQKAFLLYAKLFIRSRRTTYNSSNNNNRRHIHMFGKKEYIYSTFRMNIFGNCNLVSSRLQSGSILIKTEEFRKNATWGIK